MITQPIRAKVELKNTTIHSQARPGMAGEIILIGAFPSTNQNVQSFSSLSALYRAYNITEGAATYTQFDGSRAAKRLFMDGISGYSGATSITCVNISEFTDEADLDKYLTATEGIQVTGGSETVANKEPDARVALTFTKLKNALSKIAHDTTNMLFISSDLRLATNDVPAKGVPGTKDDDLPLIKVYKYIINIINKKFTSTRPCYFIGCIQTDDNKNNKTQDENGIGSQIINVLGSYESSTLKVPGAKQIAKCFDLEENELVTAGLFYQPGIIYGEHVDPIEFAAHICGWIASLPIKEDLTNKEIPGVTGVDEEAYFGEHDAGYLLNSFGINVIEPKNRLKGTYRVQNSITPSGWHTNHVRSVAYLLNQYELEAGLGITNLESELEAFKASLKAVTNNVLKLTDVITDVVISDDIEVIDAWNIRVPIDITLAGVVTVIHADVSMSLEDYSESNNNVSDITTSY